MVKKKASKLKSKLKTGKASPHFEPLTKKPRLKCPPEITLEELMNSYWPEDAGASSSVRLSSIRAGKPPKQFPEWTVLIGRTETDENGHIYEPRIFTPSKRLNPKSKVLIDCQCGRHVFTFEHANAARGLSFIYRCNGQAPEQTNPAGLFGACKHVIRMLKYIRKNRKVII